MMLMKWQAHPTKIMQIIHFASGDIIANPFHPCPVFTLFGSYPPQSDIIHSSFTTDIKQTGILGFGGVFAGCIVPICR